jgi:Ca2+-transporting ATPase
MWYTRDSKSVVQDMGSDVSSGLSETEAARRLEEYGPNKLEQKRRKSRIVLFLEQFNNVLIYILAGAAGLSFFLGETADGAIILGVVLINAIVGFVQESKAEEALAELQKLASPKALIRREGTVRETEADAVVPGDIVLLEAGRIVPADIRLLETADLKIEESSLTGESVPVEKDADAVLDEEQGSLGDRINMAYMSTIVTYGRGTGVVVGTGMSTEMGKIAEMLESEEKQKTPLQKRLGSFGRIIGFVILVLCAVMFGISILEEYIRHDMVSREVLFEFFLTAVSLAVAAIPEGLPAVVTIVLALGVQRMSKEKSIVRKLPAVETLGAVTVICSDKTGTLTQNRMTVTKIYVDGATREARRPRDGGGPQDGGGTSGSDTEELSAAENLLLTALTLCNDATYSEETATGDPTEVALLEASSRYGMTKEGLSDTSPRLDEKPFDSDRKMMSTVNGGDKNPRVYTKGAADSLLERCSRVLVDGEVRELTEEDKSTILKAAERMSDDALRVLAGAYRKLEEGSDPENFDMKQLEWDLIFLGMVGMIDPPREEVKGSIRQCRKAGIIPVMITGDHRITALAIARELGIAEKDEESVSGAEIGKMTEEELRERARTVRVFARVSPEHKVRIVRALRANGNIVSMTGDGVNDAPSLRTADIGVAMGITGTDVAKGASDMLLMDDNFNTIVKAVEEGRNIYRNIKKTITFLLSCNAGEIVAVFTAMVAGWASPLKPIHILWVNLITDTFPALSLGVDPGDPEVMKNKPRDPKESLFAGGTAVSVVLNGLIIGGLTLGIYILAKRMYPDSLIHAQTMAFAALSFSQLFHAFDLRHRRLSIFQMGLLTNKALLGSLGLGAFLQVAIITLPGVSDVFSLLPLSLNDWLIVLGFAVSPVVFNELGKLFLRIRDTKRSTSDFFSGS